MQQLILVLSNKLSQLVFFPCVIFFASNSIYDSSYLWHKILIELAEQRANIFEREFFVEQTNNRENLDRQTDGSGIHLIYVQVLVSLNTNCFKQVSKPVFSTKTVHHNTNSNEFTKLCTQALYHHSFTCLCFIFNFFVQNKLILQWKLNNR